MRGSEFDADLVASTSISVYSKLPSHGKPLVRNNGIPEWTILSTLSLFLPSNQLQVISLGAGVKVLPANKLPPLGDTLHDCHSEILARRGFVRWLLEEAGRIVRGESHRNVLVASKGKFRLIAGVQVCLYVSVLPCGDASMLHTAAHQPASMALLKSTSSSISPTSMTHMGTVRGRNGYEQYGAIRTKPGRADSSPAISLSCSDKLASYSVTGLQGALLSELYDPIYIDHVVVGGVEMAAPAGIVLPEGVCWWDKIKQELERALYGRLEGIRDRPSSPYRLNRPEIHLTTIEFPDSKPAIARTSAHEPVPSVNALLHITSSYPPTSEVIFNGCKQGGVWKSPGTKLIVDRARSKVCKYELMKEYLVLRDLLDMPSLSLTTTYHDLKHPTLSAYQDAKAILRGSVIGSIRSDDVFGDFQNTSGNEGVDPPFKGWIVSGKRYESFTIHGKVEQDSIERRAV
ncbi:tRNA-specific adenosine deaminase 1, partial [Tremellales sp. Uapishka_1]